MLWAPIDAWGKDNQFDPLFTTRAVMWRAQDERTFQLRPDRLELVETSDSLDGVASPLLAALRITSEELALIRELLARRGAAPRLDIAGLSAIHRVVVLARALQLRIASLDLLLRLVPPNADPFLPGDPAATRRFVEIVREVQASDFTPERLAYLFRHESDPRRDPAPLPAQVEAVLGSIRRGLADAFGETSHPAEVTGDTLRQKLALLLDPALLDPALEALDPRTTATPAARREFFDRHLARIFPDPAAAAGRLFVVPPAGTPREELESRWRANIHSVLEHLLPQLRARQLRGAVVQTLSDTLGLSIPSTARLLDTVLRSRDRKGEPLLRDFLSLLGTGLTGAYYANPDLQGEPALRADGPRADVLVGKRISGPGAARARVQRPLDGPSRRPEQGPAHLLRAHRRRRQVERERRSHRTGAHRSARRVRPRDRAHLATDHARPAPAHRDPARVPQPGRPAAALSVHFGTGPGAKQPLPTPSLYPADGLAGVRTGGAELPAASQGGAAFSPGSGSATPSSSG